MHTIKILAIGALWGLLMLAGGNSWATEYIVSPRGSDTNEGTYQRPLATIFAAAALAAPGDTVTLRGGTYLLTKPFSPPNTGTPGNWIYYRSMPGEVAVIDGSEIFYIEEAGQPVPISAHTTGIIQVEHVSYIRFEGINVINSRAAGFIIRGPDARQIELRYCKTDRTYNSGIGVWYADSVSVHYCEVVRANDIAYRNEEVPRPNEAPHEAISICGARYFDIAYNHVHDCYKEGIDCKEVSRHGVIHHNMVHDLPRQAYYVDAWFGLLEDVELHSNVGYNCAWGFAISVEGKDSELRNVRFHHNLIYEMRGSGILFGVWGGDGPRSDIHIYNNTIYKCGSPQWWAGGVGSIGILSQNFKDVYIYRNLCDKGWDYELGFSFSDEDVEKALQERNFVVAENLFESAKNRPSRSGQYDLNVVEFLPKGNSLGAPLYKDERAYDLTPEVIQPITNSRKTDWKYTPSDWYGALRPLDY